VTSLQKKYVARGFLLTLLVWPLKGDAVPQEFLPGAPADRAAIYFLNAKDELVPLPFEHGRLSLKLNGPAKETRVGFIEINGQHAATTFTTDIPRIFLFTSRKPGAHPPFLVLLAARHDSRRVTAVAQQGLAGYAVASEQIIKPNIRVLAAAGEEVFMEIRPRVSLMPGEYAMIGDDLARIATFSISTRKQ
jgi:hypothetical protein